MVSMGSSMYVPYASSATGAYGSMQQASSYGSPNAAAALQGSSANATLSQMALMANNLALTGNLFLQFAALLQMLLQGLTGNSQQQAAAYNSLGNALGNLSYGANQQQAAAYNSLGNALGNPSYGANQQPVSQQASLYNSLTSLMNALGNFQAGATQQQTPEYNGGNNARYWGDPHLIGFDGEKYDVMGEGGQIYNMLSDKGVQYNTRFIDWGKPDGNGVQPTVIGEAGIQVGKNLVYFDRSGSAPTVNGEPLGKDEKVDLGNGQFAAWNGEKLTVKTEEYSISLAVKDKANEGGYLDSTVTLNDGVNPLADGVAAHGLLGQTADGVAGHRVGGDGNQNIEKQGGSVIDGVVDDYRVDNLWDNDFQYNRFAPENPAQDGLNQLLSSLSKLAADLAA